MNNFVIDASAWVEYFSGTEAGERVKSIVESNNNVIYTNIITIAELSCHFKRKKVMFSEARKVIISLSAIYYPDLAFADEIGELYLQMRGLNKKISLADVFIILTAKKIGAKIVTGDYYFKILKEVILIK
ncbi:TPA: type II toxin-antitoxin system VapC family toxin [Candidatus Woesearchaeota archaeon]|nr:PIN domain-containing protein [Candidatus Woesearchaeota archaeon]HIH42404.1 type II toxin-antitoxin system VapC family toxin [Candidatus Woesearchaeota archaeon]